MKRVIGALLAMMMMAASAWADSSPQPVEGDYIARDFRFHDGKTLPEVRLHYTSVGAPTGIPVLVLHGTAGSGATMLTPAFAGELFGPGQRRNARPWHHGHC